MSDLNYQVMDELSRVPKTRGMVAGEYGVSVKTFNRWLYEKKLDIPQGLICPTDLNKIYSTLGPPALKKEDQK